MQRSEAYHAVGRHAPLAGVLSLVLLAYIPALRAGTVWDDDRYLTANETLAAPGGLARIWLDPLATPQYYPLVFTSFWLEHRLWGDAPWGYHLVNVLLHLVNTALVWQLCRRLGLPGAILVAGLFALHPLQVESVAWIAERKNVLSGLFFLGALLAWLRFAETRSPCRYAAVVAWFAGSLLAKTATLVFPLALVLVTWAWRPRAVRRDLPWQAALLPFSVAAAAMTAWREHAGTAPDALLPELLLVERMMLAGQAAWFYLGKFVWPVGLAPVYPRWQVSAGDPWPLLYTAALAALFVLLMANRARWGRLLAAAAGFFVLALAPSLGLVPFGFQRHAFVADHFVYLPLLGLAVLFAAIVAGVQRRSPAFAGRLPAGGGVLLLLVLAGLTWRQASHYRDMETFCRYAVARNPRAWSAHNNLGSALAQQGRHAEAIEHFRAALAVAPDRVDARFNLGQSLRKLGRPGEAVPEFRRALEHSTADAELYNAMGLALAETENLPLAARALEEAVRLRPDYAEACNNLGTVYARQGRFGDAVRAFEQALRLAPDLPGVRANLERARALDRAAPP